MEKLLGSIVGGGVGSRHRVASIATKPGSELSQNPPVRKSGWVAGLSLALLGALMLFPPFDGPLSRWSYDWGLWLRPPVELERCPVVVVYMDDDSHRQLGQTGITAWDRNLHAQLIRMLKDLGASVIAFDVLFGPPYANTNATRRV